MFCSQQILLIMNNTSTNALISRAHCRCLEVVWIHKDLWGESVCCGLQCWSDSTTLSLTCTTTCTILTRGSNISKSKAKSLSFLSSSLPPHWMLIIAVLSSILLLVVVDPGEAGLGMGSTPHLFGGKCEAGRGKKKFLSGAFHFRPPTFHLFYLVFVWVRWLYDYTLEYRKRHCKSSVLAQTWIFWSVVHIELHAKHLHYLGMVTPCWTIWHLATLATVLDSFYTQNQLKRVTEHHFSDSSWAFRTSSQGVQQKYFINEVITCLAMLSDPSSISPFSHSTNPPYILRQALPEPCLQHHNMQQYLLLTMVFR